jgi:hypothetical protein
LLPSSLLIFLLLEVVQVVGKKFCKGLGIKSKSGIKKKWIDATTHLNAIYAS